ncbi:Ig-like domain-containing protein [Shewanella sp. GXUN23E]|uniref:Ig-like domain-containing protein n=1 Tax=Shewanella sp. GXUN23E TaxID=3422498 RepID=UPI003D7D186A
MVDICDLCEVIVGVKLIISHQSWSYFAQRTGVTMRTLTAVAFLLGTSGLTFLAVAETLPQAPMGLDGAPYIDGGGGLISNLAELRWLSETPTAWDESWVQTQDIDASETRQWNIGDHDQLAETPEEPMGFAPIGSDNQNGFTGNYHGGGFRITGLVINRPNDDYIGLFGHVHGSLLKNITLESASISGRIYVGALAGWVGNAEINQCRSSGDVKAVGRPKNDMSPDDSPGRVVGGLVGISVGSAINDSSSSATVTVTIDYVGTQQTAGGLVGEVSGGQVNHSYASGAVSNYSASGGLAGSVQSAILTYSHATGKVTCGSDCGGLIGYMTTGVVEDSYATGNVASDSIYVGGLVGGAYFESQITRSYATGNVSLSNRGWGGGGLVGRCYSSSDSPKLSSIHDSYASGTVSGNTIGALVGATFDGCHISNSYASGYKNTLIGTVFDIDPIIENSFFDCTGSETGCSQPHAKTTAEMQQRQTYLDAGWDLGSFDRSGTWLVNHESYPILSQGKAALFTTLPSDLQLQGTEDQHFELTIEIEDIPANQGATFSIIKAPAWLAMEQLGVRMSLTGIPDDKGVGDNLVVVAAMNQGVRNDFPLQLVNITNINDLPMATDTTLAATEDTLLSIDLTAFVTDDDFIHGAEQHSFRIASPLPAGHGDIELLGSQLEYTPAADFFGTTQFQFEVQDIEGASAKAWVELKVAGVNDAPEAGNGQIIVNEDQTASLNLMSLVKDVDDSELLFTVAGGQYGHLSLEGAVVQYTPKTNYSGPDSFSYSVDDRHSGVRLIAGAEVSVAVLPVNDLPIAQPAHFQTAEDSLLQIDLSSLASDVDGDILSFVIASSPVAGSATVSLTGSIATLTPAVDFNGPVSFTYMVTDGAGGQASAVINIDVTPVNDAPVVTAGNLVVKEDLPGTVNLAALAQDKDNDPLIFNVGPASQGSVSLSGAIATYHPNENFFGNDTFVFSVSDGAQSVTSQIDVVVESVNDAPVISGTPDTSVDLGSQYRFVPKVADVEGDRLTFTIINKPIWARFSSRTGELVGTPSQEDNLGVNEQIGILVSDGNDTAKLPDFAIEVTGELEAGFAVDDAFTLSANSDERYVLGVLNNDSVEPGEILVLAAAQSSSGQIEIAGSNIVVTLSQPMAQVRLTYLVDNGAGQQDSADVVLNIKRDEGEGLPVIVPPEPIWANATGALTEVELPMPEAFDSQGQVLTPIRTDDKTYFTPGRHNVVWQVTDKHGQVAVAEQQLNIRPQVSLPKDTTVYSVGYDTYTVKFMLNGEAPHYPVAVDYLLTDELSGVVTEESVLIESGLEGVLDLMLTTTLNSNERSLQAYNVTLADSMNAGHNHSFTLSIQAEPQAPKVSSLLTQNGQKRSFVSIPAEGGVGEEVRIDLAVENAKDGEQYIFDWRSDNLVLRSADSLATSSATFVPQSDMEPGIYKITVNVSRLGQPEGLTQSIQHQFYLEMRTGLPELSAVEDSDGDGIPDMLEGVVDTDQDGIPDYLDAIEVPNLMPATVDSQSSYLIEVEPGLSLKKGMTIADNHGGGLLLDPELDNIVLDAQAPVLGGIFDFSIQGLNAPGDAAAIVLPQINPIPANASYRKYQITAEGDTLWVEFDYAGGAVYSTVGKPGFCPGPDAKVWTTGLTKGDWCVRLVIVDGGPNDADGVANGTVVDPGGVAVLLGDNTLPVLNNDEFVIYTDQKLVGLDVLENDMDAEDPLSIISATTSHGVVTHDGQSLVLKLPDSLPEQILIQYSVIELRENGVTQMAQARVSFKERPAEDDSGSLSMIWLYWLLVLAGYRQWGRRVSQPNLL